MTNKLSQQEFAFCEEYARNGKKPSPAALQAGLSKNYGYVLLRRPDIQEAIKAAEQRFLDDLAEQSRKARQTLMDKSISHDWVLERLKRLIEDTSTPKTVVMTSLKTLGDWIQSPAFFAAAQCPPPKPQPDAAGAEPETNVTPDGGTYLEELTDEEWMEKYKHLRDAYCSSWHKNTSETNEKGTDNNAARENP